VKKKQFHVTKHVNRKLQKNVNTKLGHKKIATM